MELNIGLSVGYIEPKTQLDSTIYHLNDVLGGLFEYRIKENEGQSDYGNERTMVVRTPFNMTASMIADLCRRLSQDSIAYIDKDGKGDLAYRSMDCTRYEFNPEYFIRYEG